MKRLTGVLLAALMFAASAGLAAADTAAPILLDDARMDGVTAGSRNWGSINMAIVTQSASAVSVAGGVFNIGGLNVATASAYNFAQINQR